MKKLLPLFFILFFQFNLFSQVSTVRQVFNFSVGDTFEYSYSFYELSGGPDCASGYIVNVITSVSQNGDTITYGYNTFTTSDGGCLGGGGAGACIGPLGPFPGGSGMAGLTTFQTSMSDSGFFKVYNLDSLIFNSPCTSSIFLQPCDTPYCNTSTGYNPTYNGRKESNYSFLQLSWIRETYVDSVGLVSRNNSYEYTPTNVAMDSLIYYRKAATGETGGQYIQPVAGNMIAGSVSKNGAIHATVYLIKQDTIGHLVEVDSVNASGGIVGNYQFVNMPTDTYYIKAALTTLDTNYASYLPTYYYDSLHWAGALPIYVKPVGTAIYGQFDINMVPGINPGGPGFVGGWVSQGAGAIIDEHNNYSRGVGSPLGNIQINLLTAGRQAVAYTYTDIDGHYSFNNLAYGSYMLYAEELNKVPIPVYFTLSPQSPADSSVNISINSNTATATEEIRDKIVSGLFPNPASDNFTLVVSELPVGPVYLKLYDITGREIKKVRVNYTKTNIRCEDIAIGIYCWQLELADKVVSRGKLVLR